MVTSMQTLLISISATTFDAVLFAHIHILHRFSVLRILSQKDLSLLLNLVWLILNNVSELHLTNLTRE